MLDGLHYFFDQIVFAIESFGEDKVKLGKYDLMKLVKGLFFGVVLGYLYALLEIKIVRIDSIAIISLMLFVLIPILQAFMHYIMISSHIGIEYILSLLLAYFATFNTSMQHYSEEYAYDIMYLCIQTMISIAILFIIQFITSNFIVIKDLDSTSTSIVCFTICINLAIVFSLFHYIIQFEPLDNLVTYIVDNLFGYY